MPGKFECCEDERLGRALWNLSLEGGCVEEMGDTDENGIWFGLIQGKVRDRDYILSVDEYGFVDYIAHPRLDANVEWARLESLIYGDIS